MLHQAQIDKPSYQEFTLTILQREVLHRKKTDLDRRMKLARLPKDHDLSKYDFNMGNGMNIPQLKQLRELLWLEQNYNLILMGPSGTGKTYIAAGLVCDAVKAGHKAYFITMEEAHNSFKAQGNDIQCFKYLQQVIKSSSGGYR